ncbi:MAG: sulfatase-like hydrolase/transferase, partial [Hyphomicrobiaceae bacterium]
RQEWWDLYKPGDIDMPKTVLTREAQDGFSQRLMDGIEASTIEVTDDEIRNARHAYYANTSYFDSKVGELVRTLEEAEMLDNTIVMVTADHGDMLGERGLWYKMNFFEHSARVPLVMAGPGVANRTIPNACSLVDVLPTMLDIAARDGAEKPTLGQPTDGRSLFPLMSGGGGDTDEAIGEYCAEMTSHPVIMIRRGRYKYIHCDVDAPLLYDLEADPDELTSLADHPDHGERAKAFADEIAARWNSEKIRSDVIATQKARRAIYESMNRGNLTSWDFQPHRDAANEYVRNHMDWTVAAEKTRFPPLPKEDA